MLFTLLGLERVSIQAYTVVYYLALIILKNPDEPEEQCHVHSQVECQALQVSIRISLTTSPA